jgi:FkbM family methyltransferase
MKFYSQVSQDKLLFERFFFGKRNGVFVDIGAYDGEKFSNSLFFEQSMGWRGLCIEPQSVPFSKLITTRTAHCEQVCVSDFEGEADFVESTAGIDETMLSGLTLNFDPRHVERLKTVSTENVVKKMRVVKLSTLLEKYGLYDIDYCSIDVEGSELSIISELDLNKFKISVFTIENNYDDERITELMNTKGYDFVSKIEQDYVFKRRDVKQLPMTTVFCAVWHGDPRRWELLRGHSENLKRQTVPVQVIYVFDGGDIPPTWLEGKAVTVREPLTIYQAWNVALSLVRTPLTMNLNLDDRLAADAVELMQNSLLRTGATIIGGDWNICYTQADTDEIKNCYNATSVPFNPDSWPPTPGTVTRLGSGTGERGTFGPATMWRMDAHIGVPHYPWRFSDGSLIFSVADSAWWGVLELQQKKLVRIPVIIGNYFSDPATQAEFRKTPEDENSLLTNVGISFL